MTAELNVLERVSTGLDRIGLSYMLTGSFAMAHYSRPRMTRDIDMVVAVLATDVERLIQEFSTDFFIDGDAALLAIESQRLFNLLHFRTGIKVDLIVRKATEYRQVEFSRRRNIKMGTVSTWIVSLEDLILSKLAWSRDSNSELQRRDVAQLLELEVDRTYLAKWAAALGVQIP